MMHDSMQAHREWSERPADERFWNLQELLGYVSPSKTHDAELVLDHGYARVVETESENIAIHFNNEVYSLNNWSMQQLCTRVSAPLEFLARMPSDLVVQCLNEAIDQKKLSASNTMMLVNPGRKIRRITSDRYTTIWDADVVSNLVDLASEGWRVPPGRPNSDPAVLMMSRAATEDDVLRNASHPSLGIKVGDMIAPAGLYAGDRDLFCFLIDESNPIQDPITKQPLYRGIMVSNSEVGSKAFSLTAFLFHSVCGNHILWGGTQKLFGVRIRHTGVADTKYWIEVQYALADYVKEPESGVQKVLNRWMTYRIADTAEEAIAFLFGKRILGKARAADAIALASSIPEAGDPLSCWGIAQALTRMSQSEMFADRRAELDGAASSIMALAAS
jgi:hypothetical protein